MAKYVCTVCGFIYDEDVGIPASDIAAHTKWEDLDENWVCPICKAPKIAFIELKETVKKEIKREKVEQKWSNLEMSILLSNLAKGCEKQYLSHEQELFNQLADYYEAIDEYLPIDSLENIQEDLAKDINENYPLAHQSADNQKDRGAKRAIVWSEKSTNMLNSLIERYQKEREAMLQDTKVFVCEICGFVYIGDQPPAICPVCKVPSLKIHEVKRGIAV